MKLGYSCSSWICWSPLKVSLKKASSPRRRTLPSPALSLLQTALPCPVDLTWGCRLLVFSFKAKLLMLLHLCQTKSGCFLIAVPAFWGPQRGVLKLLYDSKNHSNGQLFVISRMEPDFQDKCHGILSLPEDNCCFDLVYKSVQGLLCLCSW